MGGIYLGGLGCLRWACGGVRMNCRYTDEELKEDVEIRKSRPIGRLFLFSVLLYAYTPESGAQTDVSPWEWLATRPARSGQGGNTELPWGAG